MTAALRVSASPPDPVTATTPSHSVLPHSINPTLALCAGGVYLGPILCNHTKTHVLAPAESPRILHLVLDTSIICHQTDFSWYLRPQEIIAQLSKINHGRSYAGTWDEILEQFVTTEINSGDHMLIPAEMLWGNLFPPQLEKISTTPFGLLDYTTHPYFSDFFNMLRQASFVVTQPFCHKDQTISVLRLPRPLLIGDATLRERIWRALDPACHADPAFLEEYFMTSSAPSGGGSNNPAGIPITMRLYRGLSEIPHLVR